ncbi:MAG: hypothetical protein Q7S10_02150 [bacterium]|nr:hypothetical protein [bacterium]
MKLLWKSPPVEIIRDSQSRGSLYLEKYRPGNKWVFDTVGMLQLHEEKYYGSIGVIELTKDGVIGAVVPNCIHAPGGNSVEVAGVMEVLFFGVHFPKVAASFKRVFAPGSIGTSNDRDFYCPYIYTFGTKVSVGTEVVKRDRNQLVIVPAKTKVLALGGVENWQHLQ